MIIFVKYESVMHFSDLSKTQSDAIVVLLQESKSLSCPQTCIWLPSHRTTMNSVFFVPVLSCKPRVSIVYYGNTVETAKMRQNKFLFFVLTLFHGADKIGPTVRSQ